MIAHPEMLQDFLRRASGAINKRAEQLKQMDLEAVTDQVHADAQSAEMMVMSGLKMLDEQFFGDGEHSTEE